MIIKLKKRKHPYVLIDHRSLSDPELSWASKGILAYLLTKPPGWTVRMMDLIQRAKDGRHKVRGALKELRAVGYAELRQMRSENSKMTGRCWVIHERPVPERLVSRCSGNRRYSNNKKTAAAGRGTAGAVPLGDSLFAAQDKHTRIKAERLVEWFYDMSVQEGLHLLPMGAPVKGATRQGWHRNTVIQWNVLARKLLKFRGPAAVLQTWKWWKRNRAEAYVPRARTFRKFCEKFDDIVAAMERMQKVKVERKSKFITVRSDDGRREWITTSPERAQRWVEKGRGRIVKDDQS